MSNINKTPNLVAITQPNINKNAKTVQIDELHKTIRIKIDVFCNTEQDEKEREYLTNLFTHHLSLKDAEHAKALELAKIEAKIELTNHIRDNNSESDSFDVQLNQILAQLTKKKEKIENAK